MTCAAEPSRRSASSRRNGCEMRARSNLVSRWVDLAVSGPGATLTEKEKLRLHHHGLSDSAIDRMDRDFASASKSIARASPPPLGPEDATRESKSEVMAEWMHHHSMSHLGLAKDGIADECAAVAVHNKERPRPNPSPHRRA